MIHCESVGFLNFLSIKILKLIFKENLENLVTKVHLAGNKSHHVRSKKSIKNFVRY